MKPSPGPIRRVVIFTHPSMPEAATEAEAMTRFLSEHGAQSSLCTSRSDECMRGEVDGGAVDVMVALGGDGTALRAGHICAPHGVPVLGVNLGHFGFLMEVPRPDWRPALLRLLEGRFRIEERMMLRVLHQRKGVALAEWQVLNEVVVCRGQFVRPIRLKASVDGYTLANYVADGLIACTPTGSTAYALAAGGPIMPPELRNILVVAVAPHLSVDRAIILSEGARVTISVHTSHEAVLSADGQAPETVLDGDEVLVDASEHTARFVRFEDPGYFYRNLIHHMEKNPSAGT